MSLINIEKTIELDVYDHDTTPSVIKTIQMDTGTRAVFAVIQNSRQDYDIGQNASVSLTVLRPDKTKVQVTGQTFVCYTGSDGNMYGAKAELSDVALAVKGNLKAQFKITSGEQELRTEIFTINNGEALDAGDGDWAGDLDGHNLDEMAESIETLQTDMTTVNNDVSELKEGFSDFIGTNTIPLRGVAELGGINADGQYDSGSKNNVRWKESLPIVSHDVLVKVSSGYRLFIYFYDANNIFISRTGWITADSYCSVPDGARYVNVSVQTVPLSNIQDVQTVGNAFSINQIPNHGIYEDAPILSTGTDFNDVTTSGTYRFTSANSYDNAPANGSNGILCVIKTRGGLYTIQIAVYYDVTKNVYIRYLSGNPLTWKSWINFYDFEAVQKTHKNESIRTVDDYKVATPKTNIGTRMRIMSYNVAKYNNDTSTYMPYDKLINFRNMLNDTMPDVIGIQEGREYIDADSVKNTMEYLYKPMLSYNRGTGGMQILTKYSPTDGGLVRLTDNQLVNRDFRWQTMTVGNKVLLLCSAHPVSRHNGSMQTPPAEIDAPESIADRLTEYTNILKWVHQEIDLAYYTADGYDPSKRLYCPNWDYCVICGDFNSVTEEDQDNLAALTAERNFTMTNGGRLGWLWTCKAVDGSLYAADNILCSQNVIINSFNVYQGLHDSLYSDHVPVMADVTLLEVTA